VTVSEGPYRRIVVGTDGSATAEDAVRHAAELALATGARLTIVSAYTRHDTQAAATAVGGGESWIVTDAAGAQAVVGKAQDLARSIGVANLGGRTEAGGGRTEGRRGAGSITSWLIALSSQ